jgi:hypothetical protein
MQADGSCQPRDRGPQQAVIWIVPLITIAHKVYRKAANMRLLGIELASITCRLGRSTENHLKLRIALPLDHDA